LFAFSTSNGDDDDDNLSVASRFRYFQRARQDPQSDYAELVEDEQGAASRRAKTVPGNFAESGSYLSSRFPLVQSIRTMPVRYQTAFLSSLGFLISFGIRCNMGVSVVSMTHNETEKLPNGTVKLIKVGVALRCVACPLLDVPVVVVVVAQLAQFDWTPGIIGIVDSSFFWGYLITQVPGGYLAAKFPANQ
jgi:hypothetical protein